MTVLFLREGSAVNLACIDAIQPIGTSGHCKVFFAGSNEYITMQPRAVIVAAWKRFLDSDDRAGEPVTITQVQIEEELRKVSDEQHKRIHDALMQERRS